MLSKASGASSSKQFAAMAAKWWDNSASTESFVSAPWDLWYKLNLYRPFPSLEMMENLHTVAENFLVHPNVFVPVNLSVIALAFVPTALASSKVCFVRGLQSQSGFFLSVEPLSTYSTFFTTWLKSALVHCRVYFKITFILLLF